MSKLKKIFFQNFRKSDYFHIILHTKTWNLIFGGKKEGIIWGRKEVYHFFTQSETIQE